jgi:hypothetical protein
MEHSSDSGAFRAAPADYRAQPTGDVDQYGDALTGGPIPMARREQRIRAAVGDTAGEPPGRQVERVLSLLDRRGWRPA